MCVSACEGECVCAHAVSVCVSLCARSCVCVQFQVLALTQTSVVFHRASSELLHL